MDLKFNVLDVTIDGPLAESNLGSAYDVANDLGCSEGVAGRLLQFMHSAPVEGVPVLEMADMKNMAVNGDISYNSNGQIDMPEGVVYKNINFREVLSEIKGSLAIQKGIAKEPSHKSMSFYNSVLVGCKVAKESTIDMTSVVGSNSYPSYIGTNCSLNDTFLGGKTATNSNCMLHNCEGADGLLLGANNKIMGTHGNYKHCVIGPSNIIVSGKFSKCNYEEGILVLETTYEAWEGALETYTENIDSDLIKDHVHHKSPDKTHLNSFGSAFTHNAVIELASNISHDLEFPSFNKGDVDPKIGVCFKGPVRFFDNCNESLTADFRDNKKARLGEELNNVLTSNAEILNSNIVALIKETMPQKVNSPMFDELKTLPYENLDLIEGIAEKINAAIKNNFFEQNAHAEINNDHTLASSIATSVNDALSTFNHGKTTFKLKKENVKRFLVDTVKAVPGLDEFGVAGTGKSLDSAIERLILDNGRFTLLSEKEYKAHKEGVRASNIKSMHQTGVNVNVELDAMKGKDVSDKPINKSQLSLF